MDSTSCISSFHLSSGVGPAVGATVLLAVGPSVSEEEGKQLGDQLLLYFRVAKNELMAQFMN